jgi:hypothetical protein
LFLHASRLTCVFAARPDDISEEDAKEFRKHFADLTCEIYAFQLGFGGELVRDFFRGSLEDMGVTNGVKKNEQFATSMSRFVYRIISVLKPPSWKLREKKPNQPNQKIEAYRGELEAERLACGRNSVIEKMREFIQGIEPTDNDEEEKRYYSTMWRLMLGKVASEITRNTLTSVVFNLRSRVEIYFRTLSSDNGMVEYAVWLTFGGQTRPKVVEVRF